MIVTKLVGGLGNQMFQYAAGRSLALRRGVPVCVDRRSFDSYKLHAYGLDCFAADIRDAPDGSLPVPAGEGLVRRSLRRLGVGSQMRTYREPSFAFHPEVLDLPDGTYLEGYWQSEHYFSDVADTIRADFRVARPATEANTACMQRVRQSLSVSIHVRRGDYVTDSDASKVHGTCSLEYYHSSIELMRQRLGPRATFFVFSDDPAWVREQLPFGTAPHHIVEGNDAASNYEDLRLMASCQHHIIANSTFSWWGAWLNPDPAKLVIAPRRWFRTGAIPEQDLVPAGWIRM